MLRQFAVESKATSSAVLSAQRHQEAQARRQKEEAERAAQIDFAAAKQAEFQRALTHMNTATPSAHIADDISDIEEDEELFDWLDGLAAMSPSPAARPGGPRSPAWRPSGTSPWMEKPPPPLPDSPSRTRLLPRQADCVGAPLGAQRAWREDNLRGGQAGAPIAAQGSRRVGSQAGKLVGKHAGKPGGKLSTRQMGLARRREGTNPWLRPAPLETATAAPDDDAVAVQQDEDGYSYDVSDAFDANGPEDIGYTTRSETARAHAADHWFAADQDFADPVPLYHGAGATRPRTAPSESGCPPLSPPRVRAAHQEAPAALADTGTDIDVRLDEILAGITLHRLRDEQQRLERLLHAHKQEAAAERRQQLERDGRSPPVVSRSASHGVLPVRNPRPHMSTHGCRPDRDGHGARPILASRPLMPSRAPWPSAWLTTGVGPTYHGIDGQAPTSRLTH